MCQPEKYETGYHQAAFKLAFSNWRRKIQSEGELATTIVVELSQVLT